MSGKYFSSNKDLADKFEILKDKEYRSAYVREHIRFGVPYQMRAMRDQENRRWTQGKLGEKAGGKPQNVISRLEDPEYGKPNLQTLLEIAEAFDVALLLKFVPFSRFLDEFEDVSPEYLEANGFEEEYRQLEKYKELEKESKVEKEPIINEKFFKGARSVLPDNERTYSVEVYLPDAEKGLYVKQAGREKLLSIIPANEGLADVA